MPGRKETVLFPDVEVNLQLVGTGGSSEVGGGKKMSKLFQIRAQILRATSAWHQDQVRIASRTASYERRADDWILQGNLAASELMHIGRQIISALIREQVTRHEYEIQKTQIEQAREIDRILHEKFTGEELYGWMQGELSEDDGLHTARTNVSGLLHHALTAH